jgi:NDP-sugar pyrophosphorylase family protein
MKNTQVIPPLVVVLAGGEGKRFKPFVTDKTLFPFLGKVFLEHLIESIASAGFTEVLLATNNNNENWIKKNKQRFSLNITSKEQSRPLGMADAMLELEETIAGRPILVMNAIDIVDQSLLDELYQKVDSVEALVVGKKVTEHTPAGYLSVNGSKVTGIVEKPSKGEEPSDLINLVFHYFKTPSLFFKLLKQVTNDNDDSYEQALDRMFNQIDVAYHEYDGAWSKLKYPHFVLDVMNIMINKTKPQIHNSAIIDKTAIIEDSVIIDEGATVYEYAVIKGNTYIGKNVVVGNHSLVMNSHIEENSVVGAHSEVTRSYLGPETWLHHNFVGDSVLEGQANPSYGTCFSNMRLDKQKIRLTLPNGQVETSREKLGTIAARGLFSGINCSFMPGTVVGADTKITPNSLLKGLIEK